MKAFVPAAGTAVIVALALTLGVQAQTPPPAAAAHVAAAKAAAGTDFTGVFDRICPTAIAPPSPPPAPRRGRAAAVGAT